jgi:hypothetical protein
MARLSSRNGAARATVSAARRWRSLIVLALASLAVATVLSACGGGGDDGSPPFVIDISVDGQLNSRTPLNPGDTVNLMIYAGQSVVLDAGESVLWTLYAGGTVVPDGALVHYGGVDIQATTLSNSAIGITTYAAGTLPASVPITLIATSTHDSAEIGVDVLITN